MIAKIFQNDTITDVTLQDISAEPNGSTECTAYEYGAILANAIATVYEKNKPATIEVWNDTTILHTLVTVQGEEGLYLTDRVPGGMRPSIVFTKRTERIPDHYLILVDPARNINKSYKTSDLGAGEWGATTGDIGAKQGFGRRSRNVVVPKTHPDYMFGIRIMEKLMEGYQDKSECHSVKIIRKKNTESDVSGIPDEVVAELIERLMRFAEMAIKENYTVSYTDVTEAMIKQAHDALNAMRNSQTLEEFNKNLLNLMHIIPRNIDRKKGVRGMLAAVTKDYASILIREAELLDIMEGQIHIAGDGEKPGENLLERLGLEVEVATDEQTSAVKERLNDSLKTKLKRVYRVKNLRTQTQFDKYIKDHQTADGKDPEVKMFWHGSRNANWFSIMQKGLLLNPDAMITGKMFGNGVYFAPQSLKSWGYTSAGKWTGESQNTAIMALYATAYGTPHEVYSFSGSWNGFNYQRLQKECPGCDCVHAKADKGMLLNDEIIFYREDQMTIQYLCEFDLTK